MTAQKKSRVGSSALYNSENKLVGIDGWVGYKVSEYDLVLQDLDACMRRKDRQKGLGYRATG